MVACCKGRGMASRVTTPCLPPSSSRTSYRIRPYRSVIRTLGGFKRCGSVSKEARLAAPRLTSRSARMSRESFLRFFIAYDSIKSKERVGDNSEISPVGSLYHRFGLSKYKSLAYCMVFEVLCGRLIAHSHYLPSTNLPSPSGEGQWGRKCRKNL